MCDKDTLLLFASDPIVTSPSPDLITTLTHGGPFGIVGALLFWIAYYCVPMVRDQFVKTNDLYVGILKAREEQHRIDKKEFMDYENARTDKIAASVSQLAQAINQIAISLNAQADAIEKLAEVLEKIKPLQQQINKRKPEEDGNTNHAKNS